MSTRTPRERTRPRQRREGRAVDPAAIDPLVREAQLRRRQRERQERTSTGTRRAPLPVRVVVLAIYHSVRSAGLAARFTVATARGKKPWQQLRQPAGPATRAEATRIEASRTAAGMHVRPRREAAPRPRPLTAAQRREAERRRRQFVQRARLAVLVIAIAMLAVAWVKVPQMDVFSLRQVSITGSSAVPDLLVRRRIDPLINGRTIFEVDTAAVEREVERLPFVHEATVDRHMPGGISLHVSEYEPLAYGMAGSGGWLIARDGRVLVKARLQDWRDRVPVVRLEQQKVAAGERVGEEPALRLLRVMPPTFPVAIKRVEIAEAGLVATLHQGPEVRFGRAENLRTKLLVADRLLSILGPHRRESLAYIDVSVPERPAFCRTQDPCATLPLTVPLEEQAAADVADPDAGPGDELGAGDEAGTEEAEADAAAPDAGQPGATNEAAATPLAGEEEQGSTAAAARTGQQARPAEAAASGPGR